MHSMEKKVSQIKCFSLLLDLFSELLDCVKYVCVVCLIRYNYNIGLLLATFVGEKAFVKRFFT